MMVWLAVSVAYNFAEAQYYGSTVEGEFVSSRQVRAVEETYPTFVVWVLIVFLFFAVPYLFYNEVML